MNREELESIVDRHIEDLCEHFPDVQIHASYTDDDGDTIYISRGGGNWYCRVGMAHAMIDMERARTIAQQMPRNPRCEEDE